MEKVIDLINHPDVILLKTRVGGTSVDMVTKSIELELFATTTRESLFSNNRDLGAHGRDKECLSETSRPVFISTMRSDLSQPTHWIDEKDTLGSSSSWDSKLTISVRRTECSTVVTMCC